MALVPDAVSRYQNGNFLNSLLEKQEQLLAAILLSADYPLTYQQISDQALSLDGANALTNLTITLQNMVNTGHIMVVPCLGYRATESLKKILDL